MLAQIASFNRAALDAVASGPPTDAEESLGGYLARNGYGREFREWYLIPMAAAIWSSPRADIEDFPLRSFARFCANHGLLQLRDRPQWRTVIGGSREYVRRIVSGLSDVRVDCPVTGIRRQHGTVGIRYSDHGCATSEKFDQVVLACHADQALRLLDDPSAEERTLLGAIRFQPNRAVLHSDASLMPRSRRAWSAWNYLAANDPEHSRPVAVTYWINRLQPLPFRTDVLVTLNPPFESAPDRVIAEFEFDHPLHDSKAVAAQQAIPAIQGERRTWYCGAWLGYGFHEDGLRSGHAVADAIAGLPVSRGPQVPIRPSDKAGAASHIGATIPVAATA